MQPVKSDLKVLLTIIAIRKLRQLKHINMAISLNIDRSSYSRLERGEVSMSQRKFSEIAEALSTSMYTILMIANALDKIDIGEKHVKEILSLFLQICAREPVQLDFQPGELRFIFYVIKRFYPKMTAPANTPGV